MEDYKLKATNPQQYDSPELDWRIAGDTNDPSRLFFQNHLKDNLEDLKGKSVLDIGSGVGQLFPMLQDLGISDIEGLEPSKRNVEHTRKIYPNIKVIEGTLQNFIPDKLFDVVICVAVFEHIFDIKEAFHFVSKFLKTNGSFYLIIGDKENGTKSHPTSKGFMINVDVQELGEGIVATKTIYPDAVIYDIFRPLESIIKAAEESSFKLTKEVEMKSSKGWTSFRLLIFKRL